MCVTSHSQLGTQFTFSCLLIRVLSGWSVGVQLICRFWYLCYHFDLPQSTPTCHVSAHCYYVIPTKFKIPL